MASYLISAISRRKPNRRVLRRGKARSAPTSNLISTYLNRPRLIGCYG
jgi:hypothetical protein